MDLPKKLLELLNQEYEVHLDETLRDLGIPEDQLEDLHHEGVYTVRDAIMFPETLFRDLFPNMFVAEVVIKLIQLKFEFFGWQYPHKDLFIERYGSLRDIPLNALIREFALEPDGTPTVGEFMDVRSDPGATQRFMHDHWTREQLGGTTMENFLAAYFELYISLFS